MKLKCRTIERVAQNIIHAVKEQFPQIVEVECSVAKLAPPLGGKIGRVSVVLKG
jgi:dihydroneopterin aldolase